MIVVGPLTFSEQKLINKIKKSYLNLKKTNDLVIIHNLQSYVTKTQIDNYIKETLNNSDTFDIKEQHFVDKEKKKEEWIYYHEPKSKPKTIHLIFARDKSEAGNFYNHKTIKYLYYMINNIHEKERLNLCESIKNFFISISADILENPLQPNNIIHENNKIKLTNICNNYEIKLKKFLIDELGLNKFSLHNYDPNYSYYIDNNYLHIICEIPGTIDLKTFKCHANCENGKCIIKIVGEKINDISESQKNCNKFFSNRDFGNFDLEVVIENVNIDIDKGKIYNKNNGLIEIIYPTKNTTTTIYLNN